MTAKNTIGIISKMKELPGVRSLFIREDNKINTMNSEGMLELNTALSGLRHRAGVLDENEYRDKVLPDLPSDRILQYTEYDRMEADPICSQALRIHVDKALNSGTDYGLNIKIYSRGSKKDPVVIDLINTFYEWQMENSEKILFNLAKYGCWGIRPYFLPEYRGLDMQRTSVGPEGHPAGFRIYETCGRYAGVWSEYQNPGLKPRLSAPWQFTVLRAPGSRMNTDYRQSESSYGKAEYHADIWNDFPDDSLRESCDYGRSLFYGAYTAWKALEKSYLALLVARLRTVQKETMLFYPVGTQDPLEAAQMVRNLTETLQAREDADSRRSLKDGLLRISRKLILPYNDSGKGRIDFAHNQSSVNIRGIQDVIFNLKILCSSLDVQPAQVGFSDIGSLPETYAADMSSYGKALRRALLNGFERLYDIHVRLKWGKIYNVFNKPWRTEFKKPF